MVLQSIRKIRRKRKNKKESEGFKSCNLRLEPAQHPRPGLKGPEMPKNRTEKDH